MNTNINDRLVKIARMVADTKRRRAEVILHDPKERERVAHLQHDAERVDAMADEWTKKPA